MFESHSSLLDCIREYTARLAGRRTGRGRRVLVVDDEDATRRFVERVLREAGFDTASADSGVEALAVAQAGAPVDIVLTDLMMPGMAGDELVRRLRKIEPAIKVLYLTGFSDELFKDRASLWEDEAYLDKPCTATGLLQAVALLACGRLTMPGSGVAAPPEGRQPGLR